MALDWKIFTQRPYIKSLPLEEQTRLFYIANEKSIRYRSRSGTGPTGPTFTNTRSLNFDGSDDTIVVGNILPTRSIFSVSFWVNINNVSSEQVFVDNRDGNHDGWSIYAKSSNIVFKIGGLNSPTKSISGQSGNWLNVVCTSDGSTKIIYINNDGSPSSHTASYTVDVSANLTIGGKAFTSGRRLGGDLDEVAIFTTVLSPDDVATIYNGGVPGDISSLNPFLWYRFEEGSGTTATDSGTGGNDGTIDGATYSTNVPT